jgi:hypothetical protein
VCAGEVRKRVAAELLPRSARKLPGDGRLATTASASTACTSLRSTSAVPASPVARSTDRSGCISVGNGFIAARTTTGEPFVTPPSSPPARFVRRRRSGSISSCASDPRVRARAKPSPTSTPLTAWMPMSAPASRASRRSVFSAYDPSPGGTPSAATSTTPPSVSRSPRAASVAAFHPSSVSAPPISTTRLATEIPISARSDLATPPAATCTAVCRALARSSALRTSSCPNLRTPARSACPGRGSVTGFAPLPSGSPSGGHGLIPHSQFV